MRKGQRSWERVLAPDSGNKENMAKHKKITFGPIIASVTLKALSLQLNGVLIMWKIQQKIQDDAIRTARIHPAVHPVTGMKCSYGKISSPLTDISGTQQPHPVI